MSIREVVQYPYKSLVTTALQVNCFNEELVVFIDDMYETMHQQKGVGLAANQIGELRRVFVLINQETGKDECFINPEIISSSGKKTHEEGCLSFPGLFIEVERFEQLTLKFQGKNGKFFCQDYNGFNAVIIQHELDHLDGIVFIERYLKQKKKRKVPLKIENWLSKGQ